MKLSLDSPVTAWIAAIIVLLIIAFGCYKFGNTLRPPVEDEPPIVEELVVEKPKVTVVAEVVIDSLQLWADQNKLIMADKTKSSEERKAETALIQEKIKAYQARNR